MNRATWRFAHASVVGAAHLAQNTICQDRFVCRTMKKGDDEILIAAVADGAGSTSNGHLGAELACTLFAEQIETFLAGGNVSIKALNADFGRRWIEYFQAKIRETSRADEQTIREYASTFLGAVVGTREAAFFQVGDGGIVVSESGSAGSYGFAVEPSDALYVNMTDFLTDETAADHLKFKLFEKSIEDLILFSDGIFPVAVNYQTDQPHEPFLMPMIAPLKNGNGNLSNLNEKLENFLASPKINEKTDDDKTIILASRQKTNRDE